MAPNDARFPIRQWYAESAVVFRKTHDEFGALSNMAAGFPIVVNGHRWRTSEALYQALRFPDSAQLQQRILESPSPMAAKMITKPHRSKDGRADWDAVRVDMMEWCIRAKLTCNRSTFGDLLARTADQEIVEDSKRDTFWGARWIDEDRLEGQNVLGCLLMALRGEALEAVLPPPNISGCILLGEPIGPVLRTSGLEQSNDEGDELSLGI